MPEAKGPRTKVKSDKQALALFESFEASAELAFGGNPTFDGEKMPEWFHEFQAQAWEAEEDIVAVIAGWQSGKSVLGAPWLAREIQRKGPGDYGAGTPTFPLMNKKVLPELKAFFGDSPDRWATYNVTDRTFTLTEHGERALFGVPQAVPTRILCGYAQNPNSLESGTYKAFWGDEPGMDEWGLESHEVIQSRCLAHNGRILYTSRPYNFGWYKTEVWDKRDEPGIRVISFPTAANPIYQNEVSRRKLAAFKANMPDWRYKMKYEGVFTRPAGTIYDCFDPGKNACKRFLLPRAWQMYMGVDFGNVNTAAVGAVLDPTTQIAYVYRAYHAASDSAADHKAILLRNEDFFETEGVGYASRIPLTDIIAAGGAPSENDWRDKYALEGFPVQKPEISDVEAGIERVYQLFKTGRLVIFDDLTLLLADIQNYAREVDEYGNVKQKIEGKSKWHRLDALRYLATLLPASDLPNAIMQVSRRGQTQSSRPNEFPGDIIVLPAEIEDKDIQWHDLVKQTNLQKRRSRWGRTVCRNPRMTRMRQA